MNVLLIQPEMNWEHPYAEAPSMALLLLGTLAKRDGHQVKILHLDIDDVGVAAVCREFEPDVVGLTVNTYQVRSAETVVLVVRLVCPGAKIVVGGPHAGAWTGDADVVVLGEGVNAWRRLLGCIGDYDLVESWPLIDYGLVDLSRFCGVAPLGGCPSMVMMGSFGCPFQCSFCNTPVFWGKKVRYRSPDAILDDIEWLVRGCGAREVFFQDDTFNLNHDWAMSIFGGIISAGLANKTCFRITGRVNEKLVTKEYLDLAKRAGVWNIFYGIESGSQAMLDRMKKGVTVGEIERAVQMTHEAGVSTYCSFVVGLPGETRQTLMETEYLIRRIKPTRFGWDYACPFPFTEFDKEVTAKGHKWPLDYAEYRPGLLMVRTDELDFEELAAFPGFTASGRSRL